MSEDLIDWDVSARLGKPEEVAAYLNAVVAEDDPALLQAALGDVAKAFGMTSWPAFFALADSPPVPEDFLADRRDPPAETREPL
jgi:hypothetical protein